MKTNYIAVVVLHSSEDWRKSFWEEYLIGDWATLFPEAGVNTKYDAVYIICTDNISKAHLAPDDSRRGLLSMIKESWGIAPSVMIQESIDQKVEVKQEQEPLAPRTLQKIHEEVRKKHRTAPIQFEVFDSCPVENVTDFLSQSLQKQKVSTLRSSVVSVRVQAEKSFDDYREQILPVPSEVQIYEEIQKRSGDITRILDEAQKVIQTEWEVECAKDSNNEDALVDAILADKKIYNATLERLRELKTHLKETQKHYRKLFLSDFQVQCHSPRWVVSSEHKVQYVKEFKKITCDYLLTSKTIKDAENRRVLRSIGCAIGNVLIKAIPKFFCWVVGKGDKISWFRPQPSELAGKIRKLRNVSKLAITNLERECQIKYVGAA